MSKVSLQAHKKRYGGRPVWAACR